MGIGHVSRRGGKHIDRNQASAITLPLYNGNCLININALTKQSLMPQSFPEGGQTAPPPCRAPRSPARTTLASSPQAGPDGTWATPISRFLSDPFAACSAAYAHTARAANDCVSNQKAPCRRLSRKQSARPPAGPKRLHQDCPGYLIKVSRTTAHRAMMQAHNSSAPCLERSAGRCASTISACVFPLLRAAHHAEARISRSSASIYRQCG